MKVVLDANVFVGTELSPNGVCSKVLKLFTDPYKSPFELILTEKIIAETENVLTRPRIMRITKKYEDEVRLVMEDYAELGIMVPDLPIPADSCRDPKDLIYLAAADTAKAELIVSLDKDLLDLVEFRGIKILKPHEFIFIANQISY